MKDRKGKEKKTNKEKKEKKHQKEKNGKKRKRSASPYTRILFHLHEAQVPRAILDPKAFHRIPPRPPPQIETENPSDDPNNQRKVRRSAPLCS